MALKYCNVNAVRRGEDIFYCLSEACQKLFPATPNFAISNSLQYLGIDIVICSQQESEFLEKRLPEFSTGPSSFRLISEANLNRLSIAVDFETNKLGSSVFAVYS